MKYYVYIRENAGRYEVWAGWGTSRFDACLVKKSSSRDLDISKKKALQLSDTVNFGQVTFRK